MDYQRIDSNFDINKLCSVQCDRVKCCDFHPSEPWVLVSLFNGFVYVWDYELKEVVMHFEVDDLPNKTPRIGELPVRAAKFIPRKGWIVTGSSDGHIRVFDYHAVKKITSFRAHNDYIRDIIVHPTLPIILTCADDMMVKSFNWEKGFGLVTEFSGHQHYVMHMDLNPSNTNLFVSVSLDRCVYFWDLNSPRPIKVLKNVHERGIDWVTYFVKEGQLFLATSADDRSVNIFDLEKYERVRTLTGHKNNVSAVCALPEHNLLVSGGEDCKIILWDIETFTLKKTLDYGFKRIWALAHFRDMIAIGCDKGLIMIKIDDNVGNTPQNGSPLLILKTEFSLQPPLAASPIVTFICSVCQKSTEYHKAPAVKQWYQRRVRGTKQQQHEAKHIHLHYHPPQFDPSSTMWKDKQKWCEASPSKKI
eukprot:TRINITY_DN1880_c0_g1_i3.p1 TRINITY_DN1880_c0_g1~~TRINITY_DN1880_c0_g1_i3.p1  ORF type:complete len:456 (+),score=85.81 TRINITY_DN1880_c0_g1_i3:117-1370(+)